MLRTGSIPLLSMLVASAVQAVAIDWVPIGNPGNAPDTQVMTCCGSSIGTSGYGAVSYSYSIGKYEITNAQYAEFLNAVARVADPNGLYNGFMADGFGGITRSGGAGSFSYSATSGRADMPVVDISYYDTLRFANWMQNGQPNTGSQTSATTEDGTYTFSGIQSVGPRHAGAAIALASENEWYKAAYFDPTSASYFDYPTGTNAQSTCATPTAAPNSANCGSALADPSHPVGDLTPVGSYPGSPSPYGTFDQGGNVGERNETVPGGYRGNHFQGAPGELAASVRYADGVAVAEPAALGFRLVLIPEPGTGLLVSMGLVMLSRRRQRA